LHEIKVADQFLPLFMTVTQSHCTDSAFLLAIVRISGCVHSFGMILIKINEPRSLALWCKKGTDESTLGKDSSVPLTHHHLSDL